MYTPNWTPVVRGEPAAPETFTSMVSQGKFLNTGSKERSQKFSIVLTQQEPLFRSAKTKVIWRAKKRLVGVTAGLAVLNWAATWIGYNLIRTDEHNSETPDTIAEKSLIFFLSLLQCGLLLSYWTLSTSYSKAVQSALRSHTVKFRKHPLHQVSAMKCCMECLCHMIVPLPGYNLELSTVLFGSTLQVSLNDVLFLAVLLRNYHTYRCFYWFSDLSTLRTSHFLSLYGHSPPVSLTLKYYLARYSFKCILGIYGALVLLCGLMEYCLEHRTSGMLNRVWNGMWLVAYTHTTVGYGDTVPTSFIGQASTVGSCFVGIFVLGMLNSLCNSTINMNQSQLKMFKFLVQFHEKQSYTSVSVILLQRWWRLVSIRKKTAARGHFVILFYSQITLHRTISQRCRSVMKENTFEGQVEALGEEFGKKARQIVEYLRPLVMFQDMVLGM